MAETDQLGFVTVDVGANLDPLKEGFGDAMDMGKDFVETFTKNFEKSFADAFKNAVEPVKDVEKSLEDLERRYVKGVAAQQDYAKVQAQLGAILKQAPELQGRANAVLKGAQEELGKGSVAARLFASATDGVKGQLIALSAGAGPVGTFLAGLGPMGLLASAGLGLVGKALHSASEATDVYIEKISRFKNAAESLNTTPTGLIALNKIAQGGSVEFERLNLIMTRFSQSMASMKQGDMNGLGERLLQLPGGPNLVRQLQGLTDIRQQILLVADAYSKADDTQKRLITTSLGGMRLSGDTARLMNQLVQNGGKLAESYGDQAHKADEAAESIEKLKSDIETLKKSSQDAMGSIVAEESLKVQKEWAETFEKNAKLAKEFVASEDLKRILGWTKAAVSDPISALAAGLGKLTELTEKGIMSIWDAVFTPDEQEVMKSWLKMKEGIEKATQQAPVNVDVRLQSGIDMLKGGQGKALETGVPGALTTPPPEPAEARAARLQAEVALLGSGASAARRKEAALAALEIQSQKLASTDRERLLVAAKDAVNMEYASQAIAARVSALGELATVSDTVKSKMYDLQRAQLQGANLTDTQIKAVLALTEAKTMEAQVSTKAALGIASAQEMAAAKTKELEAYTKAYNLSAQEQAQLLVVLDKRFRDMAEAQEVAASRTPNLTRFALDAQNLDKQLDQFATGSLTNLNSGLTDMAMGTTTLGNGFKNLQTSVTRALTEMLVRFTILMPIAQAFRAVMAGIPGFGAALGGFGNAADAGIGTGVGTGGFNILDAAAGHTGAVIGSSYSGTMRLPASVFAGAPRHHSGTPALGMDEVPFVGKRGEVVGWPDQLRRAYGGGGGDVKVNIINNAAGVKVEEGEKRREGGANVQDIVISEVSKGFASGKFDEHMKGRYGVSLGGKSR